MEQRIPCVIMRGGTSKAVLFAKSDLPEDLHRSNGLILAAFGSPDARQVDGLGGADPLTSKLAIVGPAHRRDADIECLFGQVGIEQPEINYKISCGNTAAAVGVYAVQERMVKTSDPVTRVRILDKHTNRIIVVHVPTTDKTLVTEGEFSISGVPFPGVELPVQFLDPSGAVTGKLIPGDGPINHIDIAGVGQIEFSLIDCGNVYAIFRATDLSLVGTELPEYLDQDSSIRQIIEQLRTAIFEGYIRGSKFGWSEEIVPSSLKIAIVAAPVDHRLANSEFLAAESADIIARIINPERAHKAFAVTGAVNLAAAAAIPGTIVDQISGFGGAEQSQIRIAHPQGVIKASAELQRSQGISRIKSVTVSRTARRIMDGYVYIPKRASL